MKAVEWKFPTLGKAGSPQTSDFTSDEAEHLDSFIFSSGEVRLGLLEFGLAPTWIVG